MEDPGRNNSGAETARAGTRRSLGPHAAGRLAGRFCTRPGGGRSRCYEGPVSASFPRVRLNSEAAPPTGHLPPLVSRALGLLCWISSLFLCSTGHWGPGLLSLCPQPRSCPEAPGPARQRLGTRMRQEEALLRLPEGVSTGLLA